MNLKLSLLSVAAVAAMMIAGQSEAKAQDNGYQFGVGYGYSNSLNYGGAINGRGLGLVGSGSYGRSLRNQVPYFALHPPVYYSAEIVRRPYGVSPFAAPPGIVPVEMTHAAPQPAVITNPYFRELKQEEEAPATDHDAAGPKGIETSASKETEQQLNIVVVNPFVTPHTSDSLAKVTK